MAQLDLLQPGPCRHQDGLNSIAVRPDVGGIVSEWLRWHKEADKWIFKKPLKCYYIDVK